MHQQLPHEEDELANEFHIHYADAIVINGRNDNGNNNPRGGVRLHLRDASPQRQMRPPERIRSPFSPLNEDDEDELDAALFMPIRDDRPPHQPPEEEDNNNNGIVDLPIEPFADYRSCRFPSEQWRDQLFKHGLCHGHEWCFFCYASADPSQYTKHKEYFNLTQLVADHYGKVEKREFAIMMQTQYNKYVRPLVKGGGKEWSLQCILEHIEAVAPLPFTMCIDQVRVMSEAMRVLSDHEICMKKPDGTYGVNMKPMLLYLKIAKERMNVLTRLESRYMPDTSNL